MDKPDAWAEITENTICILFVPLMSSDWMCHIFTTEDQVNVTYRFRYYASPDPHDQNDLSEGETIVTNENNDRIIKAIVDGMMQAAEDIAATVSPRSKVHKVMMKNKNVDRFMKELESQPWAHKRTTH